MDRDNHFWLAIWAMVLIGILGIAAAIAIPVAYNHRQNTARDMYFAQHCKIVNQYTSNDNAQTLRQYQCQNK